jgi:hypothetical protein
VALVSPKFYNSRVKDHRYRSPTYSHLILRLNMCAIELSPWLYLGLIDPTGREALYSLPSWSPSSTLA